MTMASSSEDEIDRNIKKIHVQLIQELPEYISPTITPTWNAFRHIMQIYISKTYLAQCTDVFTICDKLLEKGDISYGRYGVLSDAFDDINHKLCYNIVEKYTKEIKEAQTKLTNETLQQTLSTGEHVLKGCPSIAAELTVDKVEPEMSKDVIYDMFLDVFGKVLEETMELPDHKKVKRVTDLVNVKDQFYRLMKRLRKDKIHLRKMKKRCLELIFIVETREALQKLWSMYKSGELLHILQKGFVSEEQLKICKADCIQLKVQIAEEDYQECLTKIDQGFSTAKQLAETALITKKELDEGNGQKMDEKDETEKKLQDTGSSTVPQKTMTHLVSVTREDDLLCNVCMGVNTIRTRGHRMVCSPDDEIQCAEKPKDTSFKTTVVPRDSPRDIWFLMDVLWFTAKLIILALFVYRFVLPVIAFILFR